MRINIDSWQEYADEFTGRQVKKWYLHDGQLYLFKKATIRDNDGTSVLNDVSECIASNIAYLMHLDCAQYFLCERDGVKGVITPNFLVNEPFKIRKEELVSGVDLIYHVDPNFKNTYLENPKTQDLYTVSLVLKAVEEYGLLKEALEMIIYDLLIGNFDRNPSNWGIIRNLETKQVRFSPLFDNCTCLAIPTGNERLKRDVVEVDGKPIILDQNHFKEVIHNHIISKIVLEKHFQSDGKRKWYQERKDKNLPNQAYNFRIMEYQPMFEYLTTFYSEEISSIMERMELYINEDSINHIFSNYVNELDVSRMEIAKRVVLERAGWMTSYYQQEKHNYEGRLMA